MRWLDLIFSKYVMAPLILLVLFFPPRFLTSFNRLDVVLVMILWWIIYWTVQAFRNWKNYSLEEKGAFFKRSIIFTFVLVVALFVKPVDEFIQRRYSTQGLLLLANNAKGYELHTLDLYPYTAFHPRANCVVKGPMPLEQNPCYQDFDVHSGDHGFFVDFDLDNPPPKQPDEFRIILIGGSAAQGFGAQTNDHMIYRVLEKDLNQQFSSPVRIRVINLALANSITYQNYISLNKWGHELKPDLILSFSGINDIVVPDAMKSDMPYRFQGVLGLTRSTWVTESPPILDDLAKYCPSVKTSLLGVAVRQS